MQKDEHFLSYLYYKGPTFKLSQGKQYKDLTVPVVYEGFLDLGIKECASRDQPEISHVMINSQFFSL